MPYCTGDTVVQFPAFYYSVLYCTSTVPQHDLTLSLCISLPIIPHKPSLHPDTSASHPIMSPPAFTPTLPLRSPSTRFRSRVAPLTRHPCVPPRRRRPTSHPTACLPPRLADLCQNLSSHTHPRSRALHLANLAETLPLLPENARTSHSRVSGCISNTHVLVTYQPNHGISLSGFSDARLTAGILSLLAHGLSGLDIPAVLAVTPEQILTAADLMDAGARAVGVRGVLAHVHRVLRSREENFVQNTSTVQDNGEKHTWRSKEDVLSSRKESSTVAVLLSGGVDSSVALRLALQSGLHVEAFYLKIWLEDELSHLGSCPWEDDLLYARAVCSQAGVVLHEVGFQKEYWDAVVTYAVAEARRGRTPNPDVLCNSRVKFGAFYNYVGDAFDRVITGHYARVTIDSTGFAQLALSEDVVKDQTYFLARLSQMQLSRAMFPLGEFTKPQVRKLAAEMELPNRDRRDSQGICFLGRLRFDDFLKHHLGERRGALVEFESGRELGMHRGFWFFTIGQRRGVGLSGGPWYVVAKDVDQNVVFVSREYCSGEKERREFAFEDASWLAGEWPPGLRSVGERRRLKVKLRHGPTMHEASVTRTGRLGGQVILDERDKGIAAGQVCAFYDETVCLGSGFICSAVELHNAPKKIIPRARGDIQLQAHL